MMLEQVNILGIPYKINYTSNTLASCYGQIDCSAHVIEIHADDSSNEDIEATLIHGIVQSILDTSNLIALAGDNYWDVFGDIYNILTELFHNKNWINVVDRQ